MRNRQWQAWLGFCLMAMCGAAGAESPITPHTEYHKRIRTGEQVSPLTSELFGEQINLSSGSTEFVVTDIDLPGNNALPVRLQRRFAVQSFKNRTPWGGFGSWDVEVPYLHGTFSSTNKWNLGGNGATSRCSQLFAPSVPTQVNLYEVWNGNSAHIPGAGDQELLYIGASDTPNPRPTDGATYNWGSRGNMRFTCLPNTANGYPGEGFVGVDGDGTRYYFDVGVERGMGVMNFGVFNVGMTRVMLLASRVVDRHGNWVAYDYSGDKLVGIRSSDGRAISIAYSGNTISSATANGRTWTYQYAGGGGALGFVKWPQLSAVVQPDGSRFSYSYAWQDNGYGGLNPEYGPWDGDEMLCSRPDYEQSSFTLVATHPAGTRGQFDFAYVSRARTGLPANACGSVGARRFQRVARSIDLFAITRKTLSGPGLGTQVWSYERGGYDSGLPDVAVATVVEPDGTRRHSVFGNHVTKNEGQLLQQAVRAPDGQIVQVTRNTYVSDSDAPSMPFPNSHGTFTAADDVFSARIRPVKQTTITQDGVTFVTDTNLFDVHARATVRTESNTLGYARVLRTSYFDDTGRWVLGQVSRSSQETAGVDIETDRTEFDAASRPQRTYAFGLLQQTLGYNADGTLATLTDANNNTISLSSWKRGLPQGISFPDSTSTQLSVDDNGWVRSVVEPNGASRSYDYDGMGRITVSTQAANDSVAWNATASSFSQVGGAEVGLEAGHWKRVSSTGNARSVSYYDALWRPVLEETYDLADPAGTVRQTVTRYDTNGRPVFASYPTRSATDYRSAFAGSYTTYDALGRTVRSEQDSELGRLVSTTQWLNGGGVQAVNPRGIATTTQYMMYGQPGEDMPVRITHPEGAVTEIARDALGKPLSILRRNGDSSVSVRRQYVYDAGQRLCKTMEPETGATVVGYDAAGNVLWSAAGLTLLGQQCDTSAAYASASRADRSYDSMARLLTLRFSDGQGDQDWAYWPGGKVKRVTTRNNGAATVNEYQYNLRGLPTAETVVYDGAQPWALGYGYDANGALSTLLQPSGFLIDYAPNALGQPTKAGPFASNVRYYANGGMSSFTYGNGVTHQMTQNPRGLPDRSLDNGTAGKVIDDGYDYDANGNVAAISDGLPGGPGNRDMQYDGLDRLRTVTAPSFGNASYNYDVLDNIVAATVGTRQQRFDYDHTNRLTNVRDQASGATVTGLGYDPRGNLNIRNGVAYRFDYGNRLREVTGKEAYQYDAHGRRTLASADAGQIRSMYGQDGVLRYQHDQRQAKAIDYVQLNGSLVGRRKVDIAPAALVVSAPGYSANGNYTVQWQALTGAQQYEVQEGVGGQWQGLYQGSGLSVAVSGKSSGSYRYRGRACNGSLCGNWGAEAITQVDVGPVGTPVLSAPASGINGNYTLNWADVQGAANYVLETFDGSAWTVLSDSTATSFAVAGKPAGSYRYRLKACNPQGCTAYSAEVVVVALYAPAATSVSVPATSYNGNFTLTVGAAAQASSYRIEQQTNGGTWAEINRISSTQLAITGRAAGTYGYRAFACNDAGCSGASGTATIVVTLPPTGTTTISLGGTSYSTTLSMSWGGIAAATHYEVVERANGGGWTTVYASAPTSLTLGGRGAAQWDYQVRGCNVGGCGPWSAVASVRVIGPPGQPGISVPPTAGVGAAYSVVVGQVADATGYQIDESADGANWTLIAYDRTATVTKGSGGTFYYRGRACNPAGCSASSGVGQIVVSGAPPVPTGLRFTRNTTTQCEVTWTVSAGASYYQIRSGSGLIDTTSGSVYSYDERCRRPYTVRACNAQACSAWSTGL